MVNVGRARISSEFRIEFGCDPHQAYCRSLRGSQFAVEEFGSSAVGADPIVPAEQVVNLA